MHSIRERSMKLRWSNLKLLLVFLLCGCGVNKNPNRSSILPQSSSPRAMTAGNWEMDATSSAGMAPLRFAGNIKQSGSSLIDTVHVNGSTCFDPLTTITFTGSVSSSGNVQLNSATVAGQVITLNGTEYYNSITGSYSISGGCADGDFGTVKGNAIGDIANILVGTFTSSSGPTLDISGNIAENATANPDGSYGMSGTVTFTGSCLSSGTLTSGSVQSGSFINGTSVGLQIQTDNGTLVFLGVLDQTTGEVNGNYTLSGGSCDQSGTAAVFVSSPWDY